MDVAPGIINACPNTLQGASGNLFLTLINTLIAAQCELRADGRYPPDYGPTLKDGDEFDFVIVGAGTAGSVVASRLSEISNWNVLLLEAGGYPSVATEIPDLYPLLQGTSEDWQYKVEPSNTCCVGKDRCHYARGKVLGGSSSINGMHYSRSTKHDHDKWVKAGNVGWDHESLTRHYKKIENVHTESNGVYGTTGEMHLAKYISSQPLLHTLIAAYEETGYKEYTEHSPIGYKYSLQNIYNGTRQSTAKVFLAPAKERKNLHVVVNARVGKLLIDSDMKRVLGVELTIGDRHLKVNARKEVILSTGSIASPQILMNSGIGPNEHLSELNIKVIKDLRVGDNFHDHLALPVIGVSLDKTSVSPATTELLLDTLYQMFMHRQNDQDISNFASFINTQNKTSIANIEYLHFLVRQHEDHVLNGFVDAFGMPSDIATALKKYNQEAPLLLFIPLLLVPQSRGSVRLQNTNPSAQPLIQPNCLSDEHSQDLEVMLEAVKFIQNLVKANAFQKYKPKMCDLTLPNCKSFQPQSDEFWKCFIRTVAVPGNQHLGTCKMGPANDPKAVVDQRLKVHGVNGVRVIDASIIPALSSNPYGLAIMIGEKGADMVKEDWLHEHYDL